MMEQKTLKNGLRVLMAPLKETSTVTVILMVGVGSRYEDEKVNGISHFVEHMFFKGTTRRPSTLIISKEIDGVGADFNAFTSKDHTAFYIKVNKDKLELALDLLSDMAFNSLDSVSEIELEKGVVCEEINMYQDNPMMYVEDVVEELVFKGNKLGWMIAGSKKSVRAISRQEILNFKKKFYQPQNMVLGVAGNINKKDLALVKKYFGSRGKNNSPAVKFNKFSIKQSGFRQRSIVKKTDQIQLALGWPSFGYNRKENYAAALLSVVLGGNMSSRLFIEIREKRGLAYYIRAINNPYQDTGAFIIQAGLDKSRYNEAIEAIWDEIKLIQKDGISDEELSRAKEFLKGKVAIQMEDSFSLAEWYSRQSLLGKEILGPEEKIKQFFKVTKKDIQLVANKIFTKEKFSLAIIGPVPKKIKVKF